MITINDFYVVKMSLNEFIRLQEQRWENCLRISDQLSLIFIRRNERWEKLQQRRKMKRRGEGRAEFEVDWNCMESTHSIHRHNSFSHELRSERCERTSARRSECASTLSVDFIVILPSIVHIVHSLARSFTRSRAHSKEVLSSIRSIQF